MTKNGHFWTFAIFSKDAHDSNETFYSRYGPYSGPMCAMTSKLYDWNLTNSQKDYKINQVTKQISCFSLFKCLATPSHAVLV